MPKERQSHTFDFKDLIYILAMIIPLAVTWGVYSTKINNLADRVVEARTQNVQLKEEDKKLRELIHSIQLEVNTNHSAIDNTKNGINNLKERINTIIEEQRLHHDKHDRDSHEKRTKS